MVQKRSLVRRCTLRSNKEEWLLCVAVERADEGKKGRWMASHWRSVRMGPWVAFWGGDVDLDEAEGNGKRTGVRSCLGRAWEGVVGKKVKGGDAEQEPLLVLRKKDK